LLLVPTPTPPASSAWRAPLEALTPPARGRSVSRQSFTAKIDSILGAAVCQSRRFPLGSNPAIVLARRPRSAAFTCARLGPLGGTYQHTLTLGVDGCPWQPTPRRWKARLWRLPRHLGPAIAIGLLALRANSLISREVLPRVRETVCGCCWYRLRLLRRRPRAGHRLKL
jgi:hypothetical protein